jgi:glycosyltransferase involved in cell wall biosynthesis|tara:strand:- start:555 stop:1391 length:837 start_codon:yes stop_codon:yes gene_type:complete
MFSIAIPTFNNLEYLKICIGSLRKNSSSKYEILVHVNEGIDGTLEYIKKNNITYTHTDINIGLCSSLNTIFKKASYNYFLYAHDDMYFCPEWDIHLTNEIKKIKHDKFYLSGTMIEPNTGHIKFNCGGTYNTFNEQKLISNFKKINFYDHQGSHFAPHLVSKDMWNKVGGLSEEFNPGVASDPDFNMKLWKEGVRIFKGINNFKVYHFVSLTTRKKSNFKQNRGDRTFLKKWGITTKFFKKYYLRSRTKYVSELSEPNKNISYFFELFLCKIRFLFTI